MDDPQETVISNMTDKELLRLITKAKRHTAMDIGYAVSELRKRGKFNERKRSRILEVVREKIIDEDPEAPTYYSRETVVYASIFGTLLLGAILLALNVKSKYDRWVIIVGGATCTFYLFTMASIFKWSDMSLFEFFGLGGFLLSFPIWDFFIGPGFHYKKKSIWIPSLFAVAIFLLVSYWTLTREF